MDFRHTVLVRGHTGLGMKIYGSDLNDGVRVGEITPGGAADITGSIFQGDLIYSIDGKNMSKATHDEVVKALTGKQEIHLVLVASENVGQFGPAPPNITSVASTPRRATSSGQAESLPRFPEKASEHGSPSQFAFVTPPRSSPIPAPAASGHDNQDNGSDSHSQSINVDAGESEHRLVKLSRSSNGYGMKIRSDPNVRGVRVSELTALGAAAKSGQVFKGDIILEINGVSMLDAEHLDVVNALVERSDVTLLLMRGETHPAPVSNIGKPSLMRPPALSTCLPLYLLFYLQLVRITYSANGYRHGCPATIDPPCSWLYRSWLENQGEHK